MCASVLVPSWGQEAVVPWSQQDTHMLPVAAGGVAAVHAAWGGGEGTGVTDLESQQQHGGMEQNSCCCLALWPCGPMQGTPIAQQQGGQGGCWGGLAQRACEAGGTAAWGIGVAAWGLLALLVWLRDWLRVLLLKFVLNVWDGSDEDQQQPQSGVGGEVRAARVGFCVCVCACVCVYACA